MPPAPSAARRGRQRPGPAGLPGSGVILPEEAGSGSGVSPSGGPGSGLPGSGVSPPGEAGSGLPGSGVNPPGAGVSPLGEPGLGLQGALSFPWRVGIGCHPRESGTGATRVPSVFACQSSSRSQMCSVCSASQGAGVSVSCCNLSPQLSPRSRSLRPPRGNGGGNRKSKNYRALS